VVVSAVILVIIAMTINVNRALLALLSALEQMDREQVNALAALRTIRAYLQGCVSKASVVVDTALAIRSAFKMLATIQKSVAWMGAATPIAAL
jgi:hypothetical protein